MGPGAVLAMVGLSVVLATLTWKYVEQPMRAPGGSSKHIGGLAIALRPNDAMILYNVACLFGSLHRKTEALDALRKAWDAGWKDHTWARRDPDLSVLHGDPEFERLFPEPAPGN